MNKKDKVKEYFEANRLDEAVALLSSMDESDAWVLFMRGRIAVCDTHLRAPETPEPRG
ncbi:MAG: hypothetical protein K2F78_00065 [Muribaculaceae bacterium]|nr:hypothetical protein [Muribaculaceae bacterium]